MKEIARVQEERRKHEAELAKMTSLSFDKDLYGESNRFEGYERSIALNDDDDEPQDATEREVAKKLASYTAPKNLINDIPRGEVVDDGIGFKKPSRIIDREDDYRRQRLNRIISPERHDAFAMGDATPDERVRTYADIMKEERTRREKEETLKLIAKKKEEDAERRAHEESLAPTKAQQAATKSVQAPAAAAAPVSLCALAPRFTLINRSVTS